MIAIILFAGFWIVVALGLFYVAIRGGVGNVRASLQSQSRGGRKTAGVVFAILYAGFGIAVPIALLTGNGANASSQIGAIKLTAAEKTGRELFGEHCAVCHTLSAASAVGKVGPNLDVLAPAQSLVLHTLANGCLQSPPSGSSQTCLGQGTMPPDIVEGANATKVAAFVAKVAGKE